MNTEERQLSEMLHRLTPEPPRRVTVEDVASRLAAPPRRRRGAAGAPRWSRGWAPALAALSVVAVAGTTAGVAGVMSSHHSPAPRTGGAVSQPPASYSPAPASTGPTWPPKPVAGGVWGAELINRQAFDQGSLVAGAASLYATSRGYLVRINPGTGQVAARARYTPPLPNPPVVIGSTVWVVASYGGGLAVLHGYDGTTLAQVASVTVPCLGGLPSSPGRVLSGSGGYLYVAVGEAVAVVNAGTRQVVNQVVVNAGQVTSLAVSPDGSKIYAGVGSFRLLVYGLAGDRMVGSSEMMDAPGSTQAVLATSGGVWGTAGVGMSEWAWFAPNGDLTQMVHFGLGTGAGADSIPTFSGGAVWLGGSHTLTCADPATGDTRASVAIPTDNGVLEYFGSVTVTGGQTYALYQNQAARQVGVARLTPPAACGG